jgi:hypothetical protein
MSTDDKAAGAPQTGTIRTRPSREGTLRREALCRSICARLCDERRSEDELRVIDDVLAGLERGADQYGPLDLERDGRDWNEEAAQEARDLLAYQAMARVVAKQQRRREQDDSRVQAPASPSPGFASSAPAPGSLTSRLLVEAGLAELRANAPRTAPAVVDYPGVAELDERIGLIELRDD